MDRRRVVRRRRAAQQRVIASRLGQGYPPGEARFVVIAHLADRAARRDGRDLQPGARAERRRPAGEDPSHERDLAADLERVLVQIERRAGEKNSVMLRQRRGVRNLGIGVSGVTRSHAAFGTSSCNVSISVSPALRPTLSRRRWRSSGSSLSAIRKSIASQARQRRSVPPGERRERHPTAPACVYTQASTRHPPGWRRSFSLLDEFRGRFRVIISSPGRDKFETIRALPDLCLAFVLDFPRIPVQPGRVAREKHTSRASTSSTCSYLRGSDILRQPPV